MTIREKILAEIAHLEDLNILNQLVERLRLAHIEMPNYKGNKEQVLRLAGTLSDADAADMLEAIRGEFQ